MRRKLAALSSLFEQICDANAVTHNHVKGVPVRQWVLSFPIPLGLLFATHPETALSRHNAPCNPSDSASKLSEVHSDTGSSSCR